MSEEIAIALEQVSKHYKLFERKADRMREALHPFKKRYHKEFYALNDISLEVKKGEILGIVGMNGSGKSTLLKVISGIIPPSAGKVTVNGNIVPLIELGSGFNPEFTGLENVYFYNSIMGYSRKETEKIIKKIIDFAEIGDFIHQPLKTYSSGMRARLSFAVSVNIDPQILILDEILSVGDELFRRKSFAKIEEFFKAGKTVLFVSHSEGSINQLCSRAVMLYKGRIVLNGSPKFVTMNYSKFLFSNPAQQQKMLQEFSSYKGEYQASVQTPTVVMPPKEIAPEPVITLKKTVKPYFIPNFNSKSAVITRNAEVSLTGFRIETPAGEQVNALVQNDDYVFSYQVEFKEELANINFGIGFKTEKGIQLSWKVYPAKRKYLEQDVEKGTVLRVHWNFKCLFMPGTYFLNVGIRQQNSDSEKLIFKGSDIFVFRVLPHDVVDKGGLFDTGLVPIINRIR